MNFNELTSLLLLMAYFLVMQVIVIKSIINENAKKYQLSLKTKIEIFLIDFFVFCLITFVIFIFNNNFLNKYEFVPSFVLTNLVGMLSIVFDKFVFKTTLRIVTPKKK